MVSLRFWGWIGWIGLCCVPALGKSGKGGKGGKQLKISYRFAQLTDVHIEPFYNPELLSWNYWRFWLLQCVQIGVRKKLGRLVNSSGTTLKQYAALLGLLGWIHGMSSPVQMDSKVAAGILQLVQGLVAIAEVKVIVSRFHTTCLTITCLGSISILSPNCKVLFIVLVDVQVDKKVSWDMLISGLLRNGHLKGDVCRIPEAFNKSSCCLARKRWHMLAPFCFFHVTWFLGVCTVQFLSHAMCHARYTFQGWTGSSIISLGAFELWSARGIVAIRDGAHVARGEREEERNGAARICDLHRRHTQSPTFMPVSSSPGHWAGG